jgi:hypothetical protein
MVISEQLLNAKQKAKEVFRDIEGYAGIGFGVGDCLVVLVKSAEDASNFPDTFDGVPVKVIVSGEIRAC